MQCVESIADVLFADILIIIYDVSATKPNRLMLFGETFVVYCDSHTEHTNTLCVQHEEF
jgi:hypothetical protein